MYQRFPVRKCLETPIVQNDTATEEGTYQTQNAITVRRTVNTTKPVVPIVVALGANVTFKPNGIFLDSGFTVEKNPQVLRDNWTDSEDCIGCCTARVGDGKEN